MTDHRFVSFDETPIHYGVSKSSHAPKASVVVLHGLGEHGGRYSAFSNYLAGLGFDCYFPDLRGFGKSGGRRACVKSFSDYHKDLFALHSWIARNSKGAPIFLMGHSFGGLVASSYIALCKAPTIAGLVLSSPLFGIAIPVPPPVHWLTLLGSRLFPDFTGPSHVNPQFLTHDADILSAYGKDSLIFHRISARLYREIRGLISKRGAVAAAIKGPVLLLQAGEDHIVSKSAAIDFYHKIAAADKELEVYEGFYHEILNETRRQAVYSRIGQWLSKRTRA